ncbi:hypothetical protein CPB86DRAFT_869927 [Serendipita vermifera]|nr:hypothetical protein CPB86DRAFT_869927 [Serendipita vermifera]
MQKKTQLTPLPHPSQILQIRMSFDREERLKPESQASVQSMISWKTSRRVRIYLPYELWSLILECVSDRLVHSYRQCDWQSFPLYDQRAGTLTATDITDWKNCRLVCRSFAEILKKPIKSIIYSSNQPIPEVVRILYVHQAADPRVAMTITSSYSAYKRITTMAIKERNDIHSKQVIITLMNGSKALPDLRSLTLLGALPVDFWKMLEKAFPSLIELYTTGSAKCDTPVTLSQLEILHSGTIDPGSLLHCPHLKHLSVAICLEWGHFLEAHAERLESFLIGGVAPCFSQSGILPHLPLLRTYGIPINHVSHLAPLHCPSLEHVYFCSRSEAGVSTAEEVLKVMHRSENIRFISFDEVSLPHWEAGPITGECKKRGGRLTWIPSI